MDLLHGEVRDSNRMNVNKSNRGEEGRKDDWPEAAGRVEVDVAREHIVFQVKKLNGTF